jgi:WD40 repeat protein
LNFESRKKTMSRDHLLDQPPVEGISSLSWLGESILASGNWDNSVRLFQAGNSPPFSNTAFLRHHKAPVLDISPGPIPDDSVLSGSIDGDIRLSRADNSSNILQQTIRDL